ncbi:hypothetical protein [Acidovorax sp. LjRoot117]|uniref:hypothetical protein n=1 Tax=Acidovorax sp. LjRoot117 TaxID=3342255 RepID=UPI003ED1348B
MTTNPESQCSREVTYDFGKKTAQCGASVKGHPLLCDTCRTQATTVTPAPVDADGLGAEARFADL